MDHVVAFTKSRLDLVEFSDRRLVVRVGEAMMSPCAMRTPSRRPHPLPRRMGDPYHAGSFVGQAELGCRFARAVGTVGRDDDLET
jgi:hypothetical protein